MTEFGQKRTSATVRLPAPSQQTGITLRMQYRDLKQPIEPPTRQVIVRELCRLVRSLPPDINTERGSLEEAGDLLDQDPPDVPAAIAALERGCTHAFRALHRESRPEVWLVAAAVELLR
jgi:hypothetical protein